MRPVQAQRLRQPRGDVAATARDRGLLQAHDVGSELLQLASDHGEPLLEMLAIAAPSRGRAAVQQVESDDAQRRRTLVPSGGRAAGESDHEQRGDYESG